MNQLRGKGLAYGGFISTIDGGTGPGFSRLPLANAMSMDGGDPFNTALSLLDVSGDSATVSQILETIRRDERG